MTDLLTAIKALLRDITAFTEHGGGLKLRQYQQPAAQAIVQSVVKNLGLTIVVMFSRQSGKNELQAWIEAYLLTLFSQTQPGRTPAEIVKISPTWKPQSLNAMGRLERVLKRHVLTRTLWRKALSYTYLIGEAVIKFFSGEPGSSIVGATASILLEIDEAQDVQIAKYDKDIAPMAASTNATRVFFGTAWNALTLLARELEAARKAEAADGIKRVFIVTADQVRAEVPAYGKFVDGQIAKLGRNHPLVKTQFFCETIDAQGGLFPPERLALLAGNHTSQIEPLPGRTYAMTIDIAGADETAPDAGEEENTARRDSVALIVHEVDLATVADPLIAAPTYKKIYRKEWTGIKHANLYPQIRGLVDLWRPRYIVVDATGMGEGIASFLAKAYKERLIPFVFTAKSKSDLGWSYLAVMETGRLKNHSNPTGEQEAHLKQLANVQYTIGPNQSLRWGVPDGARDPQTGENLHDDWVMSDALVTELDKKEWSTQASAPIPQSDPLDGMREAY